MQPEHEQSAMLVRGLLSDQRLAPGAFRAALTRVPALERDAWLDLVFGLDSVPEDGPELPRGCVPYLPCPVEAVLEAVAQAQIGERDLFVDMGCGLGRTALLVHFLTGASLLGIEIQPRLVQQSRELAQRLRVGCFSVLEGDAVQLAQSVRSGTVFFLYCPFGADRVAQVLDSLEPLARTRRIRICSVDLALPARPWLAPVSAGTGRVLVHAS